MPAWWERALAIGYWERRGFQPDYSGATAFIPADSDIYTAANRSVSDIDTIVIHVTGGTWVGSAISDFASYRPGGNDRRASAHYIVDRQGNVYQMVYEKNIAWHASGRNDTSIGIEHVANTSAHPPTQETYLASAYLVQYLCRKYNIAKNRWNIIGHSEADPNTDHNCPGPRWDWARYMSYVYQQPVLYVGGGYRLSAY